MKNMFYQLKDKFNNYLYKNKFVITGCTTTTPLLTRYTLFRNPNFQIKLHILHRSDEDEEYHDHPWNFWTLVLKGKYTEKTPRGDYVRRAGSILYRPATWVHRIEIDPRDSYAVTINVMSRDLREWGFYGKDGIFIPWRNFLYYKGC